MSAGFNTTPKPAFLRAMQNQSWKVAGALAELVDNGFGPGRGNARRVEITHDTKARTISVLDDGVGMEAIGRLFQLGNTVGRTPGDIGLYGSGGTMAVLWLARRVEVWTLRDGQVSHDSIDWTKAIRDEQFPVVSNSWRPATVRSTPAELLDAKHGTLIKVHLAPERRFVASNVKRDLAATYAPAIRQGRELIWTTIGKNGGSQTLGDLLVTPEDPAKTVQFNITVEVRGVDLSVTGAIGIIEGLPQSRSKVSIGFGPRVLLHTRDCYVSADRSKRYIGTGIGGWLDLGEGWQPYLTTTKDGMNDQPVWDLLMEHVFNRIKPLLEQVESDEIQVEFDNIALNLETAFGGLKKIRVDTTGARISERDGDRQAGQRFGTDDPDREQEPSQPADTDPKDDGDEPADKDEPAAASVIIYKQSDDEMEGQLCQAELAPGGVMVMVNADHPVIQVAIKAEPTNRAMLNWGIAREIADEIAAERGVMEKMLPPRVLKLIQDLDENTRARHIHRFLMDGVREGSAA